MAHQAVPLYSRSRPYSHNPPHFVELREYHASKGELRPVSNHSHPISPHATPKVRRSLEYSHSQRDEKRFARDHGVWKSSELSRKPLEYEDIYDGRFQDISTGYRGHSMREGREDGRHRAINGRLRNSRDHPDMSTRRDSMRGGDIRNEKERRENNGSSVGGTRNDHYAVEPRDSRELGYPEEQRDTRDTTGIERAVVKGKEKREPRNDRHLVDPSNTRDIMYTEEQRDTRDTTGIERTVVKGKERREPRNDHHFIDTSNTRDIMYTEEQRDTRDTTGIERTVVTGKERNESRNDHHAVDSRNTMDIGDPEEQRDTRRTNNVQNRRDTQETRDRSGIEFPGLQWTAQQTSFSRNASTTGERSSTRLLGNDVNIDITETNGVINPSSHSMAPVIPEPSSRNSPESNTPTVFLKPFCPQPETARSVSPALSLGSSISNQSHVTHHSAASWKSEVSVKSILKKPNVGRVVLKEEPSPFSVFAVVSCILCFPLGIYALVKSNNVGQVKTAIEENDYDWALSSSRKVKHFCIGVAVAYFGILFIGGAILAKYFITGKIF